MDDKDKWIDSPEMLESYKKYCEMEALMQAYCFMFRAILKAYHRHVESRILAPGDSVDFNNSDSPERG